MEVFQFFAERAAAEQPDPQMMWYLAGEECAAHGNWTGAEEAQRKIRELALVEENKLLSVKPHMNLAAILEIRGKVDEAAHELELALETARPGDITPLI